MDTLTRAKFREIMTDARSLGSLKQAVLKHDAYGLSFQPEEGPTDFQTVKTPSIYNYPLPSWADYLIKEVTITPSSVIKPMAYFDDDTHFGLYTKGEEKEDRIHTIVGGEPVQANTVYTKLKLDRDDILDLSDIDIVSAIKSRIERDFKFYVARSLLDMAIGNATTSSLSNISAMGDSFEYVLFTDNSFYKQICEYLGGSFARDVAADMLGIKKIVFAPVPTPVFFIPRTAIVGAPNGLTGRFFEDFDIDYNTRTILMESKLALAVSYYSFKLTEQQ